MIRALWSKPTLDLGAKLETLVYLHLVGQNNEIYYIRENNCEIDFCTIEDGKPKKFFQVCYDLTELKTKEREIRSLIDLGKKYNVTELYILTMNEDDVIKIDGTKIVVEPAYLYLMRE